MSESSDAATCGVCGLAFGTVSARSGHMATHKKGQGGGWLSDPTKRCPGSGIGMIERTYTVRDVTPADRENNGWRASRAEERGDTEEAGWIRESLRDWEKEQGLTKTYLACGVCGDAFLKPTAAGTARPHTRRDQDEASWDRVHQLRRDLKTLQAELDRMLDKLEP